VDEKYVWPLVGVVLGWFLSFFASRLNEREDNRRRLGRLLTKLLVVYGQVGAIKRVSEHFKDFAESWEDYERMRKGISERHFLEPASHMESLGEAIDEVSGMYPIEALALQGLIDVLQKNKTVSLSESSKSREIYVRFLSVYEVGLDACEAKLKEHIKRFAFRHGLVTYLRIWRKLSRKGQFSAANEAFAKKLMEETLAEIKQVA
jgi:hypothetical protein